MHVQPEAIGPRPVVVPTPSPHRIRSAVARAAREAGRYLGAFGDGFLLVGIVAWVAGAALSVATQRLGLGAFDVLLPALIVTVALGLVAGVVRLLLAALRRVSAAARRAVDARTGRPRVRLVAGAPDRLLRWLDARAVSLVVALVVLAILPGDLAAMLKPSGLLLPALLVAALAGGLLAAARAVMPRPGRVARVAATGSVALAVALVGGSTAWAAWPGDASGLAVATSAFDGASVSIDEPDPSAPGAYSVVTTSYGSGTDRHREAYGADVPVRTPTVSAPVSLDRYPGPMNDAYRAYWGFDFDALPLNALVWYPVGGSGPFPLVLVVHGNHTMGDFSEAGYAYLAERLASHGMVVASIDENFLNGGFAGDMGGKEMPTRAWLLLLHLDLWRQWTADPASRFHGLVDLDRVALVGHSRGGEAAATAAMFSRLDFPPVAGLDPWPTGLRVRAVVSIAPSDGQFGNGTTKLTDVDFLTITGGEDSDATGWSGIRQYARTTPADDGFKASVWIQRANHGQFNTAWGASDHGPLATWLVNRSTMMPAADQERIARVYIGGFLAASLQDRDGYRELFRAPAAGAAWLPDETALVRSSDGAFEPLLDASRPRERLLAGVTEVEVELHRVTLDLPLRALQDSQQNRVESLRWTAGSGVAEYRLDLSGSLAGGLSTRNALQFAMADGRAPGVGGTIDPTIVVRGRNGATSAHRLSEWADLAPPMPAVMYKSTDLSTALGIGPNLASPVERVLQTFALPLPELIAESGIEPGSIASIAFRFDRSAAGSVYLDEVGFAAP